VDERLEWILMRICGGYRLTPDDVERLRAKTAG